MENYYVKYVVPQNDYNIAVTFYDNTTKIFDVKPYLGKSNWFGQLKDINIFNRAFVDDDTVAWPGGQNIAPERLYSEGRRQTFKESLKSPY